MEFIVTEQDSNSYLIVATLDSDEFRRCKGGNLIFVMPGLSQRYFSINYPYTAKRWEAQPEYVGIGCNIFGRFVNGAWQGVIIRDEDISEDVCVTSLTTVKLALARNINAALNALDQTLP